MISKVFINRPVTAIVSSLIIVIIGLLTMMNLPVSQYPEITPPDVQVSGMFTGADAETVEQTVVTPLENQINGTPDMAYLKSSSTSDGRMTMDVTFNLGTDVDIAALDVQNRASIATPQLPDIVKRLGLTVRKRNPSILMVVALYSPKGTHNIKFMDNYANIYVKNNLLRVPGVGDIFSVGQDFSMRIWLKPDKLAQLGMNASEVIQALQSQNVQVAAGAVGTPPQYNSQIFQYTIFTNGRLSDVDEFKKIIVRSNPQDGSLVYLKDVARVELGRFNYSNNNMVDGKPATILLVFQSPESNALETYDGVNSALDEMQKTFPNDLAYTVPYEAASVVQVSIDEVAHTLIEALLLVILVVFIFLQNWRATLIPVLAIPVSIIGTFTFFLPLGFTINTLTLFGFVLAIGIVVDDAIVVVEATQHYIDHEKISAKEAAFKAMKDISAPVIAIALILAAVFVPVGFIPGIVGRLYQQFAITIAISVLISAFVALTLTPALCSLLLKPRPTGAHSKGIGALFHRFNLWFDRFNSNYGRGVQVCIHHSRLVIVVLVCIGIGTLFLFKHKPTGFIPTEDEGRLFVAFELPEAAAQARTQEVMNQMQDILKTVPEVNHFAAIVGINAITFASKANSGTIFMQLKDWDERKDPSQQIFGVVATLNRKFSQIKNANIRVVPPPAIPGLGSSSGFTFELEQKESPDDLKGFNNVVTNFMTAANQRPEIAAAFTFFTAHTPGYALTVDREKCAKMGVPLSDVFSTIQTFMGSMYVNDFTEYGRNFRVVAQADTSYRSDISQIGKYYVRNQDGNMIPLSTLISYKLTESAPYITHYNLFRSAEFNGNAAPGYSSGQALDALREVAEKTLPAGYGYEFSGLSKEEIKAGNTSTLIFTLCILFVFLFLAALYESWSVPFSILLAVPIGMFGAILALTFLPKLSNNVYAQIGLITLIGLAAKNAILIVEFAKERVDGGMDLNKAILDAVRLRLRPILMTSFAFILGVTPLVMASGAGAFARQTIGWTVMCGMMAATSLAIFIVPVLFVVITRLAYGKKKLQELRSHHDPGKDHFPEV